MIVLGLSVMWWALLAALVLIGALLYGLVWLLGIRGEILPIARTMSWRQRRAFRRERADITPALQRRRS